MSKSARRNSKINKTRKEGWYSVRALLRCTGKGQPRKVGLYEDRLLLVRARSHDAAQRKARRIVELRERPYKNAYGNTVTWRLARLYESVELFDDELGDGTEVYWRFIRSSNPVKRLEREGTMNGLD